MRLVIDSDKFDSISEYEWPHKIGYVNGRDSAWTPAQIKACQAKGQLLALVDVLGNAPHQAAVIDFERGDVQDPHALLKWVIVRNEFRNDAVVYCNRSTLPAVINALRGVSWRLWLAAPTHNSEPPMKPPADIKLPSNAKLLGIQYALEPHSGGHYDMSIFYDDAWHATRDTAAEVDAETRLAKSAEPRAAAAELAEDADPPAGPAGPSTPSATSAASSSSSAALRPVPAGALSRSSGSASVTASAPSPSSMSGASSPVPDPGPDVAQDAQCGATPDDSDWPVCSREPHPDDPTHHESADFWWTDGGPIQPKTAHAAAPIVYTDKPDVAAAAAQLGAGVWGPPSGPGYDHEAHTADSQAAAAAARTGDPGRMPHAWIGRVLIDLQRIAEMFEDAGVPMTAQVLREAAQHGIESGVLLQKAGK